MADKKQNLPSRELKLEIKNSQAETSNTYTIEFPDNGKLIDIEVYKAQLSDNSYQAIASTGTSSAQYTKALIDAIATFSVLIPDLKRNMNINSFMEMGPLESKDLVRAYIKEFLPWYNEWMEIINTDDEDDESGNE